MGDDPCEPTEAVGLRPVRRLRDFAILNEWTRAVSPCVEDTGHTVLRDRLGGVGGGEGPDYKRHRSRRQRTDARAPADACSSTARSRVDRAAGRGRETLEFPGYSRRSLTMWTVQCARPGLRRHSRSSARRTLSEVLRGHDVDLGDRGREVPGVVGDEAVRSDGNGGGQVHGVR